MRTRMWMTWAGIAATGIALLAGLWAYRWLQRKGSSAPGDQIEMALYLLENGAEVNATSYAGLSPLHAAAGECPAAVRPPNPYDDRAGRMRNFGGAIAHQPAPPPWLVEVAMQTDMDGLRRMVSPAEASQRGAGGHTPLHVVACQAPGAEMAALLLEHGASVNARDSRGRTPLLIASTAVRFDLAEVLLDAGADPNARDLQGRAPLHLLASPYARHQRQVQEYIATPGGHTGMQTRTVLEDRPERLAALLLDHGADPDGRDAQGLTPLQWIARTDKHPYRLVKVLVEGGADVNAGARQGTSALDAAMDRGIRLLSDYLREQGAVLYHRPDPIADLRSRF